jgi:ketosteroid isomerase-like protein
MSTSKQADDAKTLIDLEQQRCNAMMNGDTERLRELLHRDLIHVHAKGQVDGFDSYFSTGGFNVHYKRVERSELVVRVTGNSALMTGRQMLVGVRKNGTGTVTIDSRVMQVWVKEGERWQQLAFQTTPTEMSVA